MQGTWVFDHSLENGVRVRSPQRCVWLIEGDRLTTALDGKPGSQCYLTLDQSTSPRSIDVRTKRGDARYTPGRYRLAGDTLTVNIGQTRPRDLSGFGPSARVWVFKRLRR
jgi:uncharacterized protein (TIGR03067 family)